MGCREHTLHVEGGHKLRGRCRCRTPRIAGMAAKTRYSSLTRCLLACAVLAAAAAAAAAEQFRRLQEVLLNDALTFPGQTVSADGPSITTGFGRSNQITSDGRRAFSFAFFDGIENRSQTDRDYILNRLMPAAASVIARSVIVRPGPTMPMHACVSACVRQLLAPWMHAHGLGPQRQAHMHVHRTMPKATA